MTRPQRLLFLFASLATFVVSAAGPSGAVSGLEANPTDLASMVNAERAQRGLPPLTVEPILAQEAEAQSRRMSSSSQLYHSSSISSQAGPWERWAENVGTARDVQAVHRAFMDSPGHRANILGPDLTSMGVGIAARPDGIYVTELFVKRPPGYAIRRLVAGGGATEAIRELSPT